MNRLLPMALLPVLLLAACGERGADTHGMVKTGTPGHVAAGGRTSGEVIAASAKGSVNTPGPAGTPGIPQGSGGNTGGASMGGARGDQEAAPPAPPMAVRSEKSGTAPASEDVKTGVQKAPGSLQPSAPDKAGH